MNVLSLFDGMSCGHIALERAGIKVDNYFASEIDKYAIKVTHHNYPNTIQLGDVIEVKGSDLPKIDLLIGGSPCQGFSFAGNQLNFDDPRSKLFFEFVRVLHECKPRYFLLENVKMKKEHQETISRHLGVEPVEINSNLVSAQNRKRLYWTNISKTSPPNDRGIKLQDVLEQGFVDRDKSFCINANYAKGTNLTQYIEKSRRQIVFNEEIPVYEKPHGYNFGGVRLREKFPSLRVASAYNYAVLDGTTWRKLTPKECERLQTVPDNYTEGVSNYQRYKMLGNGWTVDVIVHIFKGMLMEEN